MSTSLLMFLVFIGITLGITYWASKRTGTAAEFYSAGRSITGFQNGWAVAGTTFRVNSPHQAPHSTADSASSAVLVVMQRQRNAWRRLGARGADSGLSERTGASGLNTHAHTQVVRTSGARSGYVDIR
jgi:hypothetical protein